MKDIDADPFEEQRPGILRRRHAALGGRFTFETRSNRLLKLVDAAFGGLPVYRFAASMPHLTMHLEMLEPRSGSRRGAPPPNIHRSGAGMLVGLGPDTRAVVISPRTHSAFLSVPASMARHEYHVRYEMIEFAALTLAARVQGLVPLHAACLGHRGRGALILGPSGAGKSTLCLHWLLQGREFLSEDSVFVAPRGLRAVGVPNYLHVLDASLELLPARVAQPIRDSPTIRRRSGAVKFEFDLRRSGLRLARTPLPIRCVAILSARQARGKNLMRSLGRTAVRDYLRASQPYAAHQPGWRSFSAQTSAVTAVEISRGAHPDETVAALLAVLRDSG